MNPYTVPDYDQRFTACVKLAADSLDRLRGCDVFRVLIAADQRDILALAASQIAETRPDLERYVQEALQAIREGGA